MIVKSQAVELLGWRSVKQSYSNDQVSNDHTSMTFFLSLSFVHFGRARIRAQVGSSFSSVGHPTQVLFGTVSLD